ncbi:ABC transporter substrate-binding protein [Ramlibacter albus]|uniref:ABC transporter substrate-binding protein n=1 Tax=Ramlibacter albus TaxID=2079448 RepID=A0A923M880_9BURK|nr:ABC transporter substrate-binding protein [Ramlibacter albus]MBC5764574.1 ABC transporter substrate-binding protein [Ramlibacter albus]
MLRRRTLVRATGAALLPAAALLHAQAQGRPMRVSYHSVRITPNEFEQAFERGMRERGWVPGSNLLLDYRFAGFDADREAALVTAALQSKPDLFVVADAMLSRSPWTLTTVAPMVFPAFGDPIASGATTSLSRPDGNVTGTTVFHIELSAKRLDFLKQALPDMRRAAALFNVRRRVKPTGVAASVKAGETLGIAVSELGVVLPDGLEEAVGHAARQGVQGIAVISDLGTISHRARICDVTQAHKVPTIFSNRTYLRAGGFMSYGPDLEGVFHRGAYFADRILKGAKPADLPIEQATNFQLVLNQKTAKALGRKFPAALMAQATEIIE